MCVRLFLLMCIADSAHEDPDELFPSSGILRLAIFGSSFFHIQLYSPNETSKKPGMVVLNHAFKAMSSESPSSCPETELF